MMPFLLSHGRVLKLFAVLAVWFQLGTIRARSSTYLSGFGSRSSKKTIFQHKTNVTSSSVSTPQSIANAIFSQGLNLASDEPRLWTRRSRDPDVLWFQTRGDDSNPIKTFSISILDRSGDWTIDDQPDFSMDDDHEDWIPIEGIFGLYELPSGFVWVLVTKTKLWYDAPPIQSNETGNLPWWQIRKAANFELVHLSRPDMMLSAAKLKEEVRQLRLLRQSLKDHGFYFVPASNSSVIKDMTCNMQDSLESYLASSDETKSNWWESDHRKPDPRFFWNQAAVDPILQRYHGEGSNAEKQAHLSELLKHVIPLTSAFIGIQSDVADESTGLIYDHVLISRRSRFRAGTRFTRRGADASGAVANFAETEQICLVRHGRSVQHVLSHLQTRGSIPLRWSSPADVKTYRPRVRIGTDPLAQARALRLHLLEQFSYYVEPDNRKTTNFGNESVIAKLVFVNLIDKTKDQGRLGRAFDAVLNAVMDIYAIPEEHKEEPPPPRLYDLYKAPPSLEIEAPRKHEEEMLGNPNAVSHVWFDFHAEVKDGRWDRLAELLQTLQPALDDHEYFWATAPNATGGWNIRQKQTAIVRTNCMDCLDRTNVVQSLFGRYILVKQFLALKHAEPTDATYSLWTSYAKAFNVTPTTIPWSSGETAHRLLWADNADAISRLYAGTAALKGDFTRTGQRTRRGALDDGFNSLQRYYLNNFLDADRQEGMDLLVGHASFSNVDDDLEHDFEEAFNENDDEKANDERAYVSIKQATRENIFGRLIGRMDDEERADIQEQLGVLTAGVDTKNDLDLQGVDLRWLPGDLQSHMISKAEMLLEECHSGGSGSTAFEFSPVKALGDIDRRSTSDLPWWAEYGDDSGSHESVRRPSQKDDIKNQKSMTEIEEVLPNYQRLPRLEKSQVLAILVFGMRSPLGLATVVACLLGLALLPAFIM